MAEADVDGRDGMPRISLIPRFGHSPGDEQRPSAAYAFHAVIEMMLGSPTVMLGSPVGTQFAAIGSPCRVPG